MICEECHGEGWVWVDHIPAYGVMPGDPDRPPADAVRSLQRPCPSCHGSGQQHCCEGPVGLSSDTTNQGDDDAG